MAQRHAPDQAEGLLEQIAETALDDDYYVVRSGSYKQSREFNTVLTGAVLAVFALLVAIAVLQTRTDRPATERERETLIGDVDSRKDRLATQEATAESLRDEVADLKASVVGFDQAYEELRVLVADRAAAGPGIRVRVDVDASSGIDITDEDLQTLVNGLWYSGAEAVAVNGKRIGTLTSIRVAGGIIKVNYQPIGPPYDIEALGDAETLDDRFSRTAVGRTWEELSDDGEVRFDVTRSDELSVEAAPKGRLAILHAKAIEGDA
ncbi:MAG: DUF881 domain-containing protein [Aeromicrobium sp.]